MSFSAFDCRFVLGAAAFVAVVTDVQMASSTEPAAAALRMPQQLTVAAADPLAARAYLDDSNSVAAHDGMVEVVKERYPNGSIRIERCVTLDSGKNYVNHGSWKMFSPTGSIIAEGQFDMGRRIGLWTRYVGRNESPIFNDYPYKNFKPPFTSVANFEEGVIDGEWLIEDADKRKVVQVSFKKGERHGPAIAWLPNGKMYRQATYDEGVPVGDVLEVNGTSGEFERSATYVNGRKVINKTTYHNGTRNKKSEATYLAATTVRKSPDDYWNLRFAEYTTQGKDLRHGPWKEWYANGKPQQEGYYVNDQKSGKFTYWHENGQIAVLGEYKDDVPQGLWVWYHPNGLKSAIGKYADGKLVGEWRWWNEEGKLTKLKTYNGSESLSSQPPEQERVLDLGQRLDDAESTLR